MCLVGWILGGMENIRRKTEWKIGGVENQGENFLPEPTNFFLPNREEKQGGENCLSAVFPHYFSSRFGRKNFVGPGRKFSPWFSTPPIFPSLPNNGKLNFPLSFPSYIFHPPKIHPTKHSVKR